VYDANVLYPAQLRDFLMRLALAEVVRAHWTEQIHQEWMRNVEADYPDITWTTLRRIREQMDRALPGAFVDGYEDRIERLSLPDSSDRHVLAAAIHSEASHIITFNTRDFPAAELGPWDIMASSPDPFVARLYDEMPASIIDVARTHRASLTRPPKTPDEYLRLLQASGLEQTARRLEKHTGEI
jgi:hypothetical protein